MYTQNANTTPNRLYIIIILTFKIVLKYVFKIFSHKSHLFFKMQGGGGKCKSDWSSQVEYLSSCPVCLNLSMELVSVPTKIIDISTIDKLKSIPSEKQCTKAISTLYKAKEGMPNHFHYIKFSLGGLLDYNCLVQIRHFYESRAIANLEKEEKKWFEQLFFDWGKQTMAYMMAVNVKTFFQERVWGKSLGNTEKMLRNLVGKRWVTDQEISAVFNLLNKQYANCLCINAVTVELLSSCQEMNENFKQIEKAKIAISQVLVAVNVRKDTFLNMVMLVTTGH